jgi:hypothetical protein
MRPEYCFINTFGKVRFTTDSPVAGFSCGLASFKAPAGFEFIDTTGPPLISPVFEAAEAGKIAQTLAVQAQTWAISSDHIVGFTGENARI